MTPDSPDILSVVHRLKFASGASRGSASSDSGSAQELPSAELDSRVGLTRWIYDCRRNRIRVGESPNEVPLSGEFHVRLFLDLLHPDDRPSVMRRFSACIAGSIDNYEAEYRARSREGRYQWWYNRGAVVARTASTGRVRFVEGFAVRMLSRAGEEDLLSAAIAERESAVAQLEHEMAERKRAERELSEARRYSQSVLAQMSEGVLVTDPSGKLEYANDAASKLLSTDPRELLAHNWREILPAEYASTIEHELIFSESDFSRYFELTVDRNDGLRQALCCRVTTFEDDAGSPMRTIWVLSDITEQKRRESRLRAVSRIDELTRIANRRLFLELLDSAIAGARRAGSMVAVLFLDLNGFKRINDEHGHGTGDSMLREVAMRLSEQLRRNDTVARYGGDEFVILLRQFSDTNDVDEVAVRLAESVSAPIFVGGRPLQIGVSIGTAIYPDDEAEPAALIKTADARMYENKKRQKASLE